MHLNFNRRPLSLTFSARIPIDYVYVYADIDKFSAEMSEIFEHWNDSWATFSLTVNLMHKRSLLKTPKARISSCFQQFLRVREVCRNNKKGGVIIPDDNITW
jgi:hypothetical protein